MIKGIDGRLAKLEQQMGAGDISPVFVRAGAPLPLNADRRILVIFKRPGSDGPTIHSVAAPPDSLAEASNATFSNVTDDELSAFIKETTALPAQEGMA